MEYSLQKFVIQVVLHSSTGWIVASDLHMCSNCLMSWYRTNVYYIKFKYTFTCSRGSPKMSWCGLISDLTLRVGTSSRPESDTSEGGTLSKGAPSTPNLMTLPTCETDSGPQTNTRRRINNQARPIMTSKRRGEYQANWKQAKNLANGNFKMIEGICRALISSKDQPTADDKKPCHKEYK
jgi:hypothetical protein